MITREDFEVVWKEYPEKKGKERSWTFFKWQVKTDEDYENIQLALQNYKKDMVFQRKAFPGLRWKHGSTWFNHYWKDYIDYVSPDRHKPNVEYKKQIDPVDKGESIPPEQLQSLITDFNSKLKGIKR